MVQEDKTESNLPWVEKYRPKKLSDLISHEEIINTSMNYMLINVILPLSIYLSRRAVPYMF